MKFKNNSVKIGLVIGLLLCSVVVLSSCRLWTVVELDKENAFREGGSVHFGGKKTNLKDYVASLWNSKIISYMNNKANDVNSVLDAIDNDVDKAGEKYGIRQSEQGEPWKFIVKGKGRIISVNTESRNGTVSVDLPSYNEKSDLEIQIGPVIRGTSIRDSLDFVSFGDFENQIEYAEFSSALQNKVKKEVLSDFNFEEMQDNHISFVGVFTYQGSEIVLTPVKMEVTGGSK